MGYTHLATHERYQIFSLERAGLKAPAIARELKRHASTIYRELKRNLVFDPKIKGYSPSRAQGQANWRKITKPRFKIAPATWAEVRARLHVKWSPEQISEKRHQKGLPPVSHEAIYRYIWKDKRAGGSLWRFLRLTLRRGRRWRRYSKRGQIVGRVGIENRPTIVERRSRRGDWEIDTVFGRRGKHALVTMVDRRSRLLAVKKVPSKHSLVVAKAIVPALRALGRQVHTITSDNGKEFSHHHAIAKSLNAKFFFARPYASWERGTNENTNGLLRQYFPRKLDFATITEDQLRHAVNEMNDRPRKTLGFKSPNEVFFA